MLKYVRRIYKYYRYKHYYPDFYTKLCDQPVIPNKILFIEMRFETRSASMAYMYDMLEKSGKYELVTSYLRFNFVRGKDFTSRVENMLTELATSSYVVVDDASMILSALPIREETKIVNLWHACGAFKKWGRSTSDLLFGDTSRTLDRYPNYGNLDLVTVSSPEVVWAYEEAMNLPEGIVKPLGISRTDLLFDQTFIKESAERIYAVVPEARGKKILLYAPTFRGHVGTAEAPDEIDFRRFREELGGEYMLLCKHHPFIKNPPKIPDDCRDFARDVSKTLTIEDLLCVADICISDYSSLIFEFSLFDRPMIFYAYDYDDYCDWRGFYYPYKEFTPGPVVYDQDQLLNTIRNIDTLFDHEALAAFRQKFMGSCDGHATERILAELGIEL